MKKLVIFIFCIFVNELLASAQSSILDVSVRQKYSTAMEAMKKKATFLETHKDGSSTWSVFNGKFLGMDCKIEIAKHNSFEDVHYIAVTLPGTTSEKVFMDVYKKLCNLYSADNTVASTEDKGMYVSTTFKTRDNARIKIGGSRPWNQYDGELIIFVYPQFYY